MKSVSSEGDAIEVVLRNRGSKPQAVALFLDASVLYLSALIWAKKTVLFF